MTRRAPGLLTLFAIVAVGIGVTSGYFRWAAPRAKAKFDSSMEAEPGTPLGRVERWMDFGVPMIHSRLVQMRVSRQQPWGVTHTVDMADGGDPQVWGVDLTDLSPDIVERDGLTVAVRFDEPRPLLRARLVGENARNVPSYPEGTQVPDPAERLRFLADYFLKDIREALEGDIEGARLRILVGDEPLEDPAAEDQ